MFLLVTKSSTDSKYGDLLLAAAWSKNRCPLWLKDEMPPMNDAFVDG
jgi:hypothetical protein